MRPASYLTLSLAPAVALLLVVLGVNVLVDPYNELGYRFFQRPLVEESRQAKLQRLGALGHRPTFVVLGSSRVMEIDPSLVDPRGFNLAVNSALPEDMLALVLWLERHQMLPREVVLGIDLDVFNANIPTDPRLVTARELYALVRHIPEVERLGKGAPTRNVISAFWRKYLSRRMFLDSLATAYVNIKGTPRSSDFAANGLLARKTDLRKRAENGWTFEPTEKMLAPYMAEKFTNYEKLSPDRVAVLSAALEILARHGVRPVLLLTPYHPFLRRHIESDQRLAQRLSEVRALLGDLARSHGGRFVDATEPNGLPCGAEDFWDAVHPMPECMARLAGVVWNGGPRGLN